MPRFNKVLWRLLIFVQLAFSITGCGADVSRFAQLHDGMICIEPIELADATDLMQIVYAAGYLNCRELAFAVNNGPLVDASEMTHLVLLASAEQALDSVLPAARQERRGAIAAVCDAAAREASRPENWPGVDEVVGACQRQVTS